MSSKNASIGSDGRSASVSSGLRTAAISADRKASVSADARAASVASDLGSAQVQVQASSVGSAASNPGTGSGTARLGPNFGTPGGDSLSAQQAAAFRALRLRVPLSRSATLTALRLRAKAALASSSAAGVSRLRMLAGTGLLSSIGSLLLRLRYGIASSSMQAFTRLRARSQITLASALAFTRLRLRGGIAALLGIGITNVSVAAFITAKDCAVSTPAGCIGAGANRNGMRLVVDGSAVAPVVSYVAFNLAGLPLGGMVTAARLFISTSAAPLTSQTINLSAIADADEGWSETAIVCNARPAPGAPLQSFAGGTSVNATLPIDLNSSWLARLTQRCGIGPCTLVMAAASGSLLSTSFYDREFGALQPQLALTVRLP